MTGAKWRFAIFTGNNALFCSKMVISAFGAIYTVPVSRAYSPGGSRGLRNPFSTFLDFWPEGPNGSCKREGTNFSIPLQVEDPHHPTGQSPDSKVDLCALCSRQTKSFAALGRTFTRLTPVPRFGADFVGPFSAKWKISIKSPEKSLFSLCKSQVAQKAGDIGNASLFTKFCSLFWCPLTPSQNSEVMDFLLNLYCEHSANIANKLSENCEQKEL